MNYGVDPALGREAAVSVLSWGDSEGEVGGAVLGGKWGGWGRCGGSEAVLWGLVGFWGGSVGFGCCSLGIWVGSETALWGFGAVLRRFWDSGAVLWGSGAVLGF